MREYEGLGEGPKSFRICGLVASSEISGLLSFVIKIHRYDNFQQSSCYKRLSRYLYILQQENLWRIFSKRSHMQIYYRICGGFRSGIEEFMQILGFNDDLSFFLDKILQIYENLLFRRMINNRNIRDYKENPLIY